MEYQNRIKGARNKSSGELFERACDTLFGELRARNFAHIQKTPEPMRVIGRTNKPGMFAAVFTQQAQPDYQGTMRGGQSVVIEAKYTDGERLGHDRIKPMQVAELDRHEAMGAVVAVFVCFSYKASGLIPWQDWKRLPDIVGRKSLKAEDLAAHGWQLDNIVYRRTVESAEAALLAMMRKQRERGMQYGNESSD
jgi:recombination protein U